MNKNKKLIIQNALLIVLSLLLLIASIVPIVLYATKSKQSTTYAVATLNKGADGKYHIASKADLDKFKADMDGGTSYIGETVVLDCDINYNNGTWETAKSSTFSGTFDGNGYKIYNVRMQNKSDNNGVGLFYMIDNSTIQNVWLDNFFVSVTKVVNVGLVAAISKSSTLDSILITNSSIYVQNANSDALGSVYVAGMIGYAYPRMENQTHYLNIQNCAVNLTELNVTTTGKRDGSAANYGVGGIIGGLYPIAGTNNLNQFVSNVLQITIDKTYFCVDNIELNLVEDNSSHFTQEFAFGGLIGYIQYNVANTNNSYGNGNIKFECKNSFVVINSFTDVNVNTKISKQYGAFCGGSISCYFTQGYVLNKVWVVEDYYLLNNCAYNKEIHANDVTTMSLIDEKFKTAGSIWQTTDMLSSNAQTRKNFYQKLGWEVGDLYG